VARQWRGVGSLVSERRCPLVRARPQEMLVTLWSIFRRVKMVLSFRKSRVFSRTRFQSKCAGQSDAHFPVSPVSGKPFVPLVPFCSVGRVLIGHLHQPGAGRYIRLLCFRV